MKTKYILLFGLIVILGSCSSTYRSGQTPDDVYYSPGNDQQDSYATTDGDGEDSYYYDDNDGSYYSADQESRDIRRGINDRRYRSSISFNIGFGLGGYNSFGYNPYGYNPFYNPYGYYSPFGYNSYNPFGHGFNDPFYSGFGSYYPYYGGYFGGGYYGGGLNHGYFPSYGYLNSNPNRGPRRYDVGSYNNNSGIRSGKTFNGRTIRSVGNDGGNVYGNGNQAPVRSLNRPGQAGNQQDGNTIRRVYSPRGNSQTSSEPNRRYSPRRSDISNEAPIQSNRRYSPRAERRNSTPSESNTRYTPTQRSEPRNNENNNRSNEAPIRSYSPSPSYSPPPSSPSNNGSAPVRSIRRG
ncbi:MAG: hypothetical protein ABI266_04765 [Ginsengibacter sp.]